jgi:chromosome segregation ATPase
MIDNQKEIRKMRREIESLRRDFAEWRTAKPHSFGTRSRTAERTGFRDKFQTAVADQLHHQRELFRIEGRVSALEKRVAELEQRRWANVPIN